MIYGYFILNGNKVDIFLLIVKVGDVIEVKEKLRFFVKFKNLVEVNLRIVFKWLEVNVEGMIVKVVGVLIREDIDFEIVEYLIIEFYFK